MAVRMQGEVDIHPEELEEPLQERESIQFRSGKIIRLILKRLLMV